MRRSRVGTACLLAGVCLIAGTASLAGTDAGRAVAEGPLTPSEVVKRQAGAEVTVVFRVAEGYGLSGTVPVGVLPSFALAAAAAAGEPRLTVLVSGDLVKIMDRFGVEYFRPGQFFNGKTIQVTGKLTIHPAAGGQANAKPSYQLSVSQWENFRLLPERGR